MKSGKKTMYHDFFGFQQVPFSIAPDPDFLFLGPRHKEGLEHLRNGLTGSGGFLLLTGEVGTGKTTLCRAVLEQIGDSLDIAFVINPMLSERELLATICDQFKIPGRHEKASLKRLTDHLSRFLQEASSQGRQPVVLIDEAQHLLPSVLEQLRLLTNIETNSRKLLSVVLIGQPELQELLQRRELRQVAQRIVARYHLLPLTWPEMQEYIEHRLKCVGGTADTFPTATMKAIWNFSSGTPRLINLVCDRALQLAARDEVRVVTTKHVQAAIESLSFTTTGKRSRSETLLARLKMPASATSAIVALGMLLISVSAVAGVYWLYAHQQEASGEQRSAAQDEPLQISNGMGLHTAMSALAGEWDVASFAAGPEPCAQLEDVDLACLRGSFTTNELRQFNVPALIQGAQEGQQYYLLVGYQAQQSGGWQVWDGNQIALLSDAQFARLYAGNALILWQVPFTANLAELIREGLAERVPYSLQQRDIERQLQWLRQNQAGRIPSTHDEGDLAAVELAILSTAYFQRGPRLTDDGVREFAVNSADEPIVRYPGAANRLAELMIPQLSLTIPPAVLLASDTEPAESVTVSEGTRLTNPHQRVETSELDAVSPHIRALFDDAVADVGLADVPEQAPEPARVTTTQPLRDVRDLSSAEKARLPRFTYNSHMYSSRTQERWIRINDRMLWEGDLVNGLRVVTIEPAHTIFGFGDMLFRVEALEDFTD
ncbi:AAA family ATPase [Aliidiomarina sp.]|uniref:AAA family ATPase n=1 Tax=Aliidiomarina sp. TaxID=1872439 RepID=UPI003A4DD8F2